MNTRIVAIVALSCGLLGLVVARPGSAESPDRLQTLPDIPGLVTYSTAQLAVPQTTGEAFDTAVTLGGQVHVLHLEPHSVRSRDFQLLVDHGDGQLVPVEPAAPSTYRGTVQGVPGSYVAASLHDGSLTAHIVMNENEAWGVEPVASFAGVAGVEAGTHIVYRNDDVLPPAGAVCGTNDGPVHVDSGIPAADGGGAGGTNRVIDLACDTDAEYYAQQGSSVLNTMRQIEATINGVDVSLDGVRGIYQSQINLVFELTTIIVRTDPDTDPYSSSSCGGLLNQVTSTFNSAPESSIRRDVAELFTGKTISGGCLGIAWTGTVCIGPAYNVVWPAGVTGFASRIALSAHEISHNFNASHCCGQTCCGGCGGVCDSCRIMCPCIGGCSQIISSFGNLAVNQISNWVNSHSCVQSVADGPLTPPFVEEFPITSLNQTHWIYNKGAVINGNAANEPSPTNSFNLNASGAGLYQDDDVRTNFIDLTGHEDSGWDIQFATQHNGVEAGEILIVEYWGGEFDLWVELDTITSDGTNPTEFTTHTYALSGLDPSPFHPEFRLRFHPDVSAGNDHWYIDNVIVGPTSAPCPWDLDGDGSVGITDFLDLLAQWGSNPGGPPDFDGDHDVGITDFLELLGNWGPCP